MALMDLQLLQQRQKKKIQMLKMARQKAKVRTFQRIQKALDDIKIKALEKEGLEPELTSSVAGATPATPAPAPAAPAPQTPPAQPAQAPAPQTPVQPTPPPIAPAPEQTTSTNPTPATPPVNPAPQTPPAAGQTGA